MTQLIEAAYGSAYPQMDKLANRLATHNKSNGASVPYGSYDLVAFDNLVECLCFRSVVCFRFRSDLCSTRHAI